MQILLLLHLFSRIEYTSALDKLVKRESPRRHAMNLKKIDADVKVRSVKGATCG